MGKLSRVFGILFVVFVVIYALCHVSLSAYPGSALMIAGPMTLIAMATGVFFILFLVMYVLKR